MFTLYLIRHGRSDASSKRRQKPSTHLGQTGKYQAAVIASRLGHIDAIFSSPLTRAKETAKIIGDRKSLSVDTLSDLREIERPERFYGEEYDHPDHAMYMIERKNAILECNMDWRYDSEGESFSDLFFRCLRLKKWLESHYGKTNKKLVLVGHSNLLSMLMVVLILGEKAKPTEIFRLFKEYFLPHGGMSIVVCNNDYSYDVLSIDRKNKK